METELKLLIAPDDAPAFRRLALLKKFAAAKPVTRLLRNTYFDTPDLDLKSHGMELRVRRVGDVSIQTLKAGGPANEAGLHQRYEWETRVDGLLPELGSLIALIRAGSTLKKVISGPGVAKGLAPVFSSDIRRTVWNLRLAQGSEVELSLDLGELKHGEQREAISEVEIELKAGATQALFDLALQLQAHVPLRVGNRSKAARGYALQATVAAAAMQARPMTLRAEMNVEACFQTIFSGCITQMQDNEIGVLQGEDPESIHQMRVGMRRLRSALRLFARWIPFPPTLEQELGWLASELGAARDADVLADGTLPKAIEICPQEAELLALRDVVSTIACEKRQQAAAAVASVRHSRLMLRLVAWLHTSHWRESLTETARGCLAAPLARRATRILACRHKKLIKLGRRLTESTPEVRHEVRIAAKKARYATEFFQSLYPSRRVKRYVSGLEALQDRLGWLNDAAVADSLLRELEVHRPGLTRGASFARGCLCATTKEDLRGLDKLWKGFTMTKPPWDRKK